MTFCFRKVIHHKAIKSVVVEIENENVSISTHKRDINNVVNKIKKPEQLIYTSEEVGLMIERITGKQLVTVNQTRVNDIIETPLEIYYKLMKSQEQMSKVHMTLFGR